MTNPSDSSSKCKTALITGITGQDGAYLAQWLLSKGYEVIGTTRTYNHHSLWRLEYLGILEKVAVVPCDVGSPMSVTRLLVEHEPAEVYNLAAQSSVSLSFAEPATTLDYNTRSVVNLLECIRILNPKIRLYQASSSEMFGNAKTLPVTRDTPFDPINPYATSKATAHWTVRNYREAYGLYCCCGILFNHESFLRSPRFFTKQIIRNAFEIAEGKKDRLLVGNLDVRRDFGCAERYVQAMWLMMQQEEAQDIVVCSGKSVSLRDVVEDILSFLSIPPSVIEVDPALYRPSETYDIYGDNTRALALGWDYDLAFRDVLHRMMEQERTQRETAQSADG